MVMAPQPVTVSEHSLDTSAVDKYMNMSINCSQKFDDLSDWM